MNANDEKKEKYAVLKSKLVKAIKNEFWLEACMIEYAIIEDRSSSILYYAKVCKNAYDSSKRLKNKLNSIEYQIGKKHPIISKKVSYELIEEIKEWKDNRNNLVHRACICYDEIQAKKIATDGKILVDRLINESAKVKRLSLKLEG